METELKNLTIKKFQELLKEDKISSREIVNVCFDNINKKNKGINALLEVFDDAFKEAEKEDQRIKSGQTPKPLSGVPFAIKDNIMMEGRIVSAASRILANHRASYDATAIKKLREAGAIFLGRANMDEFAMGSSSENSAFGPVKNPYDLTRVAGGSSGGPAAALASDMCLAALGSDTGGSIRTPAAFCGVVGLKPTYGAVSRSGLIAMASSLDQIGPIAKTIEDAEIIFNVIKGKDPADSTTVEYRGSTSAAGATRGRTSFTIGIPKEYFSLSGKNKGLDEGIIDKFKTSIEKLKKLGHQIKEVSLPHTEYVLSCYYIIVPAEISANLARFDGVKYGLYKEGKNLFEDYLKTRGAGFGKEVRRRIILGTYVLSAGYYEAYYQRAQKVRVLIKEDFKKVFSPPAGGVDILLTPVSPTPAFKIGEKTDDPVKMYLADIFTVSANLAGLPALSLPNGFVELEGTKLPSALQLISPWFEEEKLFYLGKQL